jgi:hypothetical protein
MTTKTETKHTPGPWAIQFTPLHPQKLCIMPAVGRRIAVMDDDTDDDRADANVRLIAASPMMFEALENVVHQLSVMRLAQAGPADEETELFISAAVDNARAAIAKATGKE